MIASHIHALRPLRPGISAAFITTCLASTVAAAQEAPTDPHTASEVSDEDWDVARHVAMSSRALMIAWRMLNEQEHLESMIDRGPLLARKLAVDSAMAPAVLLLELAGSSRFEPLAMLRVEYQDRTLALESLSSDTTDLIGSLGAAWESAVRGGVGFEYRSWRTGAAEADFPVLIHWRGQIHDGSLKLRAHWFEPFLAQRRLDFPLNPEALLIEFTPDGASISSPFPNPVSDRRGYPREAPRLRNPEDLYDIFDSLRLASFVLRHPTPSKASTKRWTATLFAIEPEDERGPSGPMEREVRTVEWTISGGQIARLQILQPMLLLRCESAHRLVGQATIGGRIVGSEARRATAWTPWMPTGLIAQVALRAPDASLDRSTGADPAMLERLRLPQQISLSTLAQPLAVAQFGSFRFAEDAAEALGSEESWSAIEAAVQESFKRRDRFLAEANRSAVTAVASPYTPEEILDEVDPLIARARLRVNLIMAALQNDAEAHDRAISQLLTRLEQDGVGRRWAVMNVQAWFEELAGPMDRPELALSLAAPVWLALAGTLDPSEQLAELARLIVAGRWELTLLLARSLKGQEGMPAGAHEWLAHLERVITPWAGQTSGAVERLRSNEAWDARTIAAVRSLLDAESLP